MSCTFRRVRGFRHATPRATAHTAVRWENVQVQDPVSLFEGTIERYGQKAAGPRFVGVLRDVGPERDTNGLVCRDVGVLLWDDKLGC